MGLLNGGGKKIDWVALSVTPKENLPALKKILKSFPFGFSLEVFSEALELAQELLPIRLRDEQITSMVPVDLFLFFLQPGIERGFGIIEISKPDSHSLVLSLIHHLKRIDIFPGNRGYPEVQNPEFIHHRKGYQFDLISLEVNLVVLQTLSGKNPQRQQAYSQCSPEKIDHLLGWEGLLSQKNCAPQGEEREKKGDKRAPSAIDFPVGWTGLPIFIKDEALF